MLNRPKTNLLFFFQFGFPGGMKIIFDCPYCVHYATFYTGSLFLKAMYLIIASAALFYDAFGAANAF